MISPKIKMNQIPGHESLSNGVVLPFTQSLHQREFNRKPCIFCGLKIKTRTFKGKAVCLTCLKSIPFIFNCG